MTTSYRKAAPIWQTVLRWIAVLPGAVAAMILAGLLFGVINWLGSSRFGDDSWFDYIWQNGMKAAAEGAAFVWFGAYIAPQGKKAIGIILAGLILFISGASFFFVVRHEEWMNGWRLLATNAAAIGMAIHVFNERTN